MYLSAERRSTSKMAGPPADWGRPPRIPHLADFRRAGPPTRRAARQVVEASTEWNYTTVLNTSVCDTALTLVMTCSPGAVAEPTPPGGWPGPGSSGSHPPPRAD